MQIRSTTCRLGLALVLSLGATAALRAQDQSGAEIAASVSSANVDDAAVIAVDLPQPPVRPRVVRRPASVPVAVAPPPARPVREQALFRPVAVAKTFWLTVGTGF